jgi:SLT domain-containing protein
VTGTTIARLGEGGRPEAVLPLNENVYRQIGQGIAAARGGGGMQLVVNYTGSGKWTREDAQGLGRMLVSELRSMGVRA